jgi:hypothetical protein
MKTMTEPALVAEAYLATWNETDPARRDALIARHWAEGATYVDPLAEVAGAGQIGTLIAGVQQRFPGFRFALKGRADGYADRVRFSWSLGPAGSADAPIEGSDVVTVEGDRITQVIGFLDKVPQAA